MKAAKPQETKDTARTFIAIPMPFLVKQQVSLFTVSLQAHLKRHFPEALPYIRWIKQENLHVTLRFLGSITPEQVNFIKEHAEPVIRNTRPFKTVFTTLVAFPSFDEPQIIALAPHPQPPIIALAYKMEDIAKECGLAAEKQPYQPHLTIARIDRKTRVNWKNINAPKVRLAVEDIFLFQSKLGDEASVYEQLAAFPLATNASLG